MILHSLILLLFLSIVPTDGLQCYGCSCQKNDLSACDCGSITTDYYPRDYCVIIEQRDVNDTFIELSRIPREATWLYVEDAYYILAIESIRYNSSNADWYLFTYGIIYGCDWDLCNDPSLINVLPNSFALSIDKAWLNTNIYGTGSVNSCHTCPQGECFDETHPLNVSNCPPANCNNVTSCLAYDLWVDLPTNEQCYTSACAPASLDTEDPVLFGGKYKVDVEAIVYLARNRSTYDIWEIDVFCAAENCTRFSIFSEIEDQLSATLSNFTAFPLVRPTTTTTAAPINNPITCYQCECYNSASCPCNTTTTASSDDGYCVIIRESFGQTIYVYSDFYSYYNAERFIYDFPFALVEESITYDEGTGRWNTQTNLVIYGCNWNLCNKPELIPLLPNSFQMRLPETWLNTSVLGSGQPVRDCHQCPNNTYCGDTDYIDANFCPIQTCNTTCRVVDTYENPEDDYLCFQSSCLTPTQDSDPQNRHRIEIEGLIFAKDPDSVELWEIDIYCRADNCSSPTIFRELRQQLQLDIGNLGALFNETHDPAIPQRRCYDCYCLDAANCECDAVTPRPSNSTYCLISQQYIGQDIFIDFGHIDRESTRVHIREYPYLLVEESIIYNSQIGHWNTIVNFVIFGCDWDYCNHPSLAQYLPTSFQMRLPETWLNSSVLGTGKPVRNCRECRSAPVCSVNASIDTTQCPSQPCNSTCLIFDTFDDPSHGLQCYRSYCATPSSDTADIDRYRVEIEGILYLPKQPRSVELWEVDIYCRADDCSRPEIFQEIKDQLTVDYGDISVFEQLISTTQTIISTSPIVISTTETTGSATVWFVANFKFYIILSLIILFFKLN